MIQLLRYWVLPMLVVACVGMTGCSIVPISLVTKSAETSPPEVSVEELQARRRAAAVEAAKATTVDTEAPGFNMFKPCEELGEEIIEPLNFKVDPKRVTYGKGGSFCMLAPIGAFDAKGAVALHGDSFGIDLLKRENAFHEYLDDPDIPGAFLSRFGTLNDKDDNCTVSMMTPRGRFSVQFAGTYRNQGRVEDCPRAIEYFKQFYKLPETQDALYGTLESYR